MEDKMMELYNRFRAVPVEALKPISAGRLKGKSDINPMWRIKALTEALGPCGFGWKYEIVRFWLEAGKANEISAFCQINLYVKVNDEWSAPIPGVGGSAFVAMEKQGLYQSDECYKMALTDAISVSCKALGVAADVYYKNDVTKYTPREEPKPVQQKQPVQQKPAQQKPHKLFTPDKVDDVGVMKWIYAQSLRAKKEGRRFSAANLLNDSYVISKEDISKVVSNYENYIINNNLPQV